MTISLEKENNMEWWKQIAVGEPDIDTTKVPFVRTCLADLLLLLLLLLLLFVVLLLFVFVLVLVVVLSDLRHAVTAGGARELEAVRLARRHAHDSGEDDGGCPLLNSPLFVHIRACVRQ
jgi:hypothetical protein